MNAPQSNPQSQHGEDQHTWNQISTTSQLLSLSGFHAVLWTLTSVCAVAFAARLYIRIHCFRRPFADDYIMMFALALLIAMSGVSQVYLTDVYKIVDFENGKLIPDATLPGIMTRGLRGFGLSLTLALVGILAVKINFLLFFRRLGTQITRYLVFWWVVVFITFACGATNIGLMGYDCVFGSTEYLATQCQARRNMKRYFDFQIISVVLDVFSDLFIIAFPVVILWNVRISLRKKLVLSGTFGLVALTIAVTIVRGSVFGGTYKKFHANEEQNLNVAWMMFWIYIEFAVAFLIACIISFRALFAQHERRTYDQQILAKQAAWEEAQKESSEASKSMKSSLFRRVRKYHDSLLTTFRALETGVDMKLPEPESGRFSATFLREIEGAHCREKSTGSSGSEREEGYRF